MTRTLPPVLRDGRITSPSTSRYLKVALHATLRHVNLPYLAVQDICTAPIIPGNQSSRIGLVRHLPRSLETQPFGAFTVVVVARPEPDLQRDQREGEDGAYHGPPSSGCR